MHCSVAFVLLACSALVCAGASSDQLGAFGLGGFASSSFGVHGGGSSRHLQGPTVTGSRPQRCLQPKETGKCRASFTRYYFNPETEQCETFVWGGCPRYGIENNFQTPEECDETCVKVSSPSQGGGDKAGSGGGGGGSSSESESGSADSGSGSADRSGKADGEQQPPPASPDQAPEGTADEPDPESPEPPRSGAAQSSAAWLPVFIVLAMPLLLSM